ncbi:flocculation-associated PEP-CTERM protein PepA [Roseateles sp. NT4]|uniref:flocculation-associated PEP-CTERM protein PepA n=1 Tax=Roseateles sp. NT4 TaxID=3453715 RepID=UPI003EEAC7C3
MHTAFKTLPASWLPRGLLAAGLLAASAGASALNSFTFDPSAAGLAGTSFTADNLLISDYATVTRTSTTTFTETGFLAITGAQLGNTTLTIPGLNSSYGLYIAFTGSGTTDGNNPLTQVSVGSFTSLTYTLYGYNGTASFGFSGTTPTTTAAAPVVLATGSLLSGGVVSFPGGGAFSPSATASVSVGNVSPAFTLPAGFYSRADTSFTNTSSQVQPFANGFMVQQGGGSINFAAPVPEPMTSTLLLGGLGVIGFLARRRGTSR